MKGSAVRRQGGATAPTGRGTGTASGAPVRGATWLLGGGVVLITGGRDFYDAAAVRAAIEGLDPRPGLVLHGGSTGADALADRIARELGIPVHVFPADWTRYGRSAGPRRNAEMIALRPDLVLAFPGGRGTANCVLQARLAGIPTTVLS